MMHFALKLGGPIASGADFNVKAILSGETDYYVDVSEGEGLHAAHAGTARIPTRDEDDDAERAAGDVTR